MKNMGKLDRTIRTVLGVLLIITAAVLQVATGGLWWIGLLGVVFLATSAVSTCPLYIPFRINTIGKGE